MVVVLYHVETYPGVGVDRVLLDYLIGHMYGYQQVIIDPEERWDRRDEQFPLILRSLEEARSSVLLRGLKWVYLQADAEQTLQEYQHPDDDVIYCVGSDVTGLGPVPEGVQGLRVAIPDPDEELGQARQFFAMLVIPAVLHDRAYKQWQRRHLPTT